jgi:hypothetical protein
LGLQKTLNCLPSPDNIEEEEEEEEEKEEEKTNIKIRNVRS